MKQTNNLKSMSKALYMMIVNAIFIFLMYLIGNNLLNDLAGFLIGITMLAIVNIGYLITHKELKKEIIFFMIVSIIIIFLMTDFGKGTWVN